MKLTTTLALMGLTLAAGPALSLASDHIDGVVTKDHSITDLSDLYAFQTPGKPGSLTLVLNVHPFALEQNHFSEKVAYNFVLREASATMFAVTGGVQTKAGTEKTIRCSFDDRTEPHTMTVDAAGCGMTRTVDFEVVDESLDSRSGLRVFAGHRADPFFFSAPWAGVTAAAGKIAPDALKGTNSMDRLNTLCIVIDVDLEKLFGKRVGLLAVVAESVDAESGKRFDRVGRPEVTNVTMVAHPGDDDIRDEHNTETPFGIAAVQKYRDRIEKNIAYYDNLDGSQEWTEIRTKAYAKVVADDFLLVDLSQEGGAGYFSIETELLAGKRPSTQGGRLLGDDIMDTLFTRLINAGQGPIQSDGVDAPYVAPSDVFPYQGAPSFDTVAVLTAAGARKLSGLAPAPDAAHTHAPAETHTHHDEDARETTGLEDLLNRIKGIWRR